MVIFEFDPASEGSMDSYFHFERFGMPNHRLKKAQNFLIVSKLKKIKAPLTKYHDQESN